MLDISGTGVEFGEPGSHSFSQRRQVGNRELVLSSRRTQRKQPLFDFLELARVGFELARSVLERRQRLGGFRRSPLDRGKGRIEQSLRALAGPFQPPRRASQ